MFLSYIMGCQKTGAKVASFILTTGKRVNNFSTTSSRCGFYLTNVTFFSTIGLF